MSVLSKIAKVILVFGLIENVNGDRQKCRNAFECRDQQITHSVVTASGYKSIHGHASKISGHEVQCDGAFSCNNIGSIDSSFIMCSGDNSCSDSEGEITGVSGISCFGANSCSYSAINAGFELDCGGSQSCANTHINDAPLIFGKGAYSLYNSVINAESVHSERMDIYFYGYHSGYNTIVLCDNEDLDCYIHCFGNGCHNTRLWCLNDNCHVDCYETECPKYLNVKTNNVNEVLEYLKLNEHTLLTDEHLHMIDDIFHLSESANTQCSEESNNHLSTVVTLDNFKDSIESDDKLFSNNVCFRGAYSTVKRNGKKQFSNDANLRDNDVPHTKQQMKNNDRHGNVLCSGAGSCVNTQIELNSNEYNKLQGKRLLCTGTGACSESKIFSHVNDNVHCSGTAACDQATIYNASVVYCDGLESCRGSKLYGVSAVFKLSVHNIAGSLVSPIYDDEDDDDINDDKSIIMSDGIGHLVVNLLAYQSGTDLKIFCNKTDHCTVNCAVNGSCIHTTVYYSDNNVKVDCREEFQTYCPNMVSIDTLDLVTKHKHEHHRPDITNHNIDYNTDSYVYYADTDDNDVAIEPLEGTIMDNLHKEANIDIDLMLEHELDMYWHDDDVVNTMDYDNDEYDYHYGDIEYDIEYGTEYGTEYDMEHDIEYYDEVDHYPVPQHSDQPDQPKESKSDDYREIIYNGHDQYDDLNDSKSCGPPEIIEYQDHTHSNVSDLNGGCGSAPNLDNTTKFLNRFERRQLNNINKFNTQDNTNYEWTIWNVWNAVWITPLIAVNFIVVFVFVNAKKKKQF